MGTLWLPFENSKIGLPFVNLGCLFPFASFFTVCHKVCYGWLGPLITVYLQPLCIRSDRLSLYAYCCVVMFAIVLATSPHVFSLLSEMDRPASDVAIPSTIEVPPTSPQARSRRPLLPTTSPLTPIVATIHNISLVSPTVSSLFWSSSWDSWSSVSSPFMRDPFSNSSPSISSRMGTLWLPFENSKIGLPFVNLGCLFPFASFFTVCHKVCYGWLGPLITVYLQPLCIRSDRLSLYAYCCVVMFAIVLATSPHVFSLLSEMDRPASDVAIPSTIEVPPTSPQARSRRPLLPTTSPLTPIVATIHNNSIDYSC